MKKLNLTNIEAIEIYKHVLSGSLSRFPKGFWEGEEGFQNAKYVTIWLIEEHLKLTDEQLKKQCNKKMFIDNKLRGMIYMVFANSTFKAIENAYPKKYKPWEIAVPQSYWNLETAAEATRWLIEVKLKMTEEQLKKHLSASMFFDNQLGGMLHNLFNNSPSKAVDNAYPGKYKLWEFNCVANNYWTPETSKEATIWLIEEELKLTDEEVKENLSYKLFQDNKLASLIDSPKIGRSLFKVIDNAYPKKYKPTDFKNYNYYKI